MPKCCLVSIKLFPMLSLLLTLNVFLIKLRCCSSLNVYSLIGKEECGGFLDNGRGDLLGKKLSAVLFSMDSKTTPESLICFYVC